MTMTQRLADMAESARSDAFADGDLHVMRLSILDWAACAIAGQHEPVTKAVRHVELENSGVPVATVIGARTKLPMRGAAMVNGTAAHALDFDDTHFAHIGHPSAVIVSAALAMAEAQGDMNGDHFLRGAFIGAEASVHVGVWLGRGHYEAGFHQTATAGTIGAAVAGAAIMNLSRAQAISAIGLAATRAAGLKVQFGTMGKPYHAGMSAATAVEAVHAAMKGLEGAREVLEGPFGFGATHHGQADEAAFSQSGMRFPSVSHKYHACCHGTHASIESCLELAGKCDVKTVEAVEVKVHPRWLDVCAIPQPQTRLEAKFSLSATCALALLGRSLTTDMSFERDVILARDVVELRDKVHVVGDAGLTDTQAQVRIIAAGQSFEATHDLAAQAPLAVREKRVREKAAALLGQTKADALWSAITASGGFDLSAFTYELRQEA